MTSAAHKWETRLRREGMPAEIVISSKQVYTGVLDTTPDETTSQYWTTLTHVVYSLNGEFSAIDKRILRAYVESGYLAVAARREKVSRRRVRTAIKRLNTWISLALPPRRKEKAR